MSYALKILLRERHNTRLEPTRRMIPNVPRLEKPLSARSRPEGLARPSGRARAESALSGRGNEVGALSKMHDCYAEIC